VSCALAAIVALRAHAAQFWHFRNGLAAAVRSDAEKPCDRFSSIDGHGPNRTLIVNADAALQLSHCCHWRIAQHFDQLEPSSAEKV
jgi:hypothetical protein